MKACSGARVNLRLCLWPPAQELASTCVCVCGRALTQWGLKNTLLNDSMRAYKGFMQQGVCRGTRCSAAVLVDLSSQVQHERTHPRHMYQNTKTQLKVKG